MIKNNFDVRLIVLWGQYQSWLMPHLIVNVQTPS